MSSAPVGPRSESLAARPGEISCQAVSSTALKWSRKLYFMARPTPACHFEGPGDKKNLEWVGRLLAVVWPVVLCVSANPAKSTFASRAHACRCLLDCSVASDANSA